MPAISFADSILQTASMVRFTSVAVTVTNHTIFPHHFKASAGQSGNSARLGIEGGHVVQLPFCVGGDLLPEPLFLLPQLGRELGPEVVRLEHLANLDLRFPIGHRIGTPLDPLDCLFE